MEPQVVSQTQPVQSVQVTPPVEKKRFQLPPRLLMMVMSTLLSVCLFVLIVRVMSIPGILVMIAVALANSISQVLMHPGNPFKKLLWGIGGLVASALLIMLISLLLVNVFHA